MPTSILVFHADIKQIEGTSVLNSSKDLNAACLKHSFDCIGKDSSLDIKIVKCIAHSNLQDRLQDTWIYLLNKQYVHQTNETNVQSIVLLVYYTVFSNKVLLVRLEYESNNPQWFFNGLSNWILQILTPSSKTSSNHKRRESHPDQDHQHKTSNSLETIPWNPLQYEHFGSAVNTLFYYQQWVLSSMWKTGSNIWTRTEPPNTNVDITWYHESQSYSVQELHHLIDTCKCSVSLYMVSAQLYTLVNYFRMQTAYVFKRLQVAIQTGDSQNMYAILTVEQEDRFLPSICQLENLYKNNEYYLSSSIPEDCSIAVEYYTSAKSKAPDTPQSFTQECVDDSHNSKNNIQQAIVRNNSGFIIQKRDRGPLWLLQLSGSSDQVFLHHHFLGLEVAPHAKPLFDFFQHLIESSLLSFQ